MKNKKRSIWKRFWHFIWEENTTASNITSLILAFILIKFIVYPVLGVALGTHYPVVAVVSGSMEHDGNFNNWWNSEAWCNNKPCTQGEYYSQFSITKETFKKFPFPDGFNTGDMMVLKGEKPENIKVGDIIVFKNNRPEPIIHRVINKWTRNNIYYFQTKGDHNKISINNRFLSEKGISQDEILGKAVFKLPYLGWVKIAAVESLKFILKMVGG